MSGQECTFDVQNTTLAGESENNDSMNGRRLTFFDDAYEFITADETCTVYPTDECGYEFIWYDDRLSMSDKLFRRD